MPASPMTTPPFRPLSHFLRHHTRYLPLIAFPSPFPSSCPTEARRPSHFCTICLTHASDSRERMIRVDLPTCAHIFGSDCFERLIYTTNLCPLCRTPWFAAPERSGEGRGSMRVIVLMRREGMTEADFTELMRGPVGLANIAGGVLGRRAAVGPLFASTGRVMEVQSGSEAEDGGNGSEESEESVDGGAEYVQADEESEWSDESRTEVDVFLVGPRHAWTGTQTEDDGVVGDGEQESGLSSEDGLGRVHGREEGSDQSASGRPHRRTRRF